MRLLHISSDSQNLQNRSIIITFASKTRRQEKSIRNSGAAHERRREGVGAKRVGRKRAYVIYIRTE